MDIKLRLIAESSFEGAVRDVSTSCISDKENTGRTELC
jgi:hypothetical protein